MQKSASVICPSCNSENVKPFSELAEKEFICEDCGKTFGTTNFNTPKIE